VSRFRIVYLHKAQQDLLEIFAYIAADRPQAARRILMDFDRSIARLEKFPRSGTVPNDPALKRRGYRILVVEDYLVFYLIKDKLIQIRRVLHGRGQYGLILLDPHAGSQ